MGVPVVTVTLDGNPVRMVLDTGCEHGFVVSFPKGGAPSPDLEDHHPMTGAFRSECREYAGALLAAEGSPLDLGPVRMGRIPPLLGATLGLLGLGGVIGFSVLKRYPVLFRNGMREIRAG